MNGICYVGAGKLVVSDELTANNPKLAEQINKYSDAIKDVCEGNGKLCIQLSSFISDALNGYGDTFLNWLNNISGFIEGTTKTSDNLLDGDKPNSSLNLNTFKKWIRGFKAYIQDSVNATSTKSYLQGKEGLYTSEQAVRDGAEYVGRSIITSYLDRKRDNFTGIKEDSLTNIIWNDVSQDIISQYLRIANQFVISGNIKVDSDVAEALKTFETRVQRRKLEKEEAEGRLNKKVKEVADEINKLETERKTIGLKKDAESVEKRNKLNTRLKDLQGELATYKNMLSELTMKMYNDIYTDIFTPIVTATYDAIQPNSKFYKLKNQGALATDLIMHPAEVRDKVFSLSIMQGLKSTFSNVYEDAKILLPDITDEMIDNLDADDNADSFDKGSQAWEDKLASDYKKFFGGNLYVYFSSIPHLNTTQRVGPNQDYDYSSDSELGTPAYYSAVEVINALTAFCPCLSGQTFIEAIEKLSERAGYEGFIKIADDMRANPVNANAIASRFALNVARKDIITISEDGAHFRQSNLRAFPRTQIYLTLSNDARHAYGISYNSDDATKIHDIQSRIKELNKSYDDARKNNISTEAQDKKLAALVNDADKFIRNYLNKFFPSINVDLISKHLYASKTNQIDFLIELFSTINDFNNAINKVYANSIKERERVYKANKDIKVIKVDKYTGETYRDYAEENTRKVHIDESRINFNSTAPSLRAFADIFYDILESNIELNSRTANNNMASDVIKNSYLTNFFKMLDDVVEESVVDPESGTTTKHLTYRGAEILKDFLSKKSINFEYGDNDFSTILYGVKDNDGKTIIPGLFTMTDDGKVTINDDNIKIIQGIKYALFSGVRNQTINTGAEYDTMPARDYYISTILAFLNPIDYNYNFSSTSESNTLGIGLDNFANFMMRIPSDASNNYIIQMPKLKTSDRFKYDYTNANQIIDSYINSTNVLNRDEVEKLVTPFYSTKNIAEYKVDKDGNRRKINLNTFTDFVDIISLLDNVIGFNVEESAGYSFIADGTLSKYAVSKDTERGKELYSKFVSQNPKLEDKELALIPVVYNDKSNNGVVVWTLSYLDGNRFVVNSIELITSLETKPTKENGVKNFTQAYNENIENISNYFYRVPHYNKHTKIYNDNSQIVCGFRQQVENSLIKFANGIQSLIYLDKDGKYKIKTNTDGLFNKYHYKKGSPLKKVDNHLELSGGIFNTIKLFNVDDFNPFESFKSAVSLYGESNENSVFVTDGDSLVFNTNNTSAFILQNIDGNIRIIPNFNNLRPIVNNIVEQWLEHYDTYIIRENEQYASTLSQAGVRLNEQPRVVSDAILNQTFINMEFDDLFEGSSVFYGDAQTFLKRAKEVQANGYAYMGAIDFTQNYDTSFNIQKDIILRGEPDSHRESSEHKPIHIKNSFKAVTIKNTFTVFDGASEIREKLIEQYKEQGVANAEQLATDIAVAYGYPDAKGKQVTTCANDAQSYITLDEFIRRKWADGTIDDYGDLLYKLKYNILLTADEVKQVGQKIQAQKNVYYDRAFDDKTNVFYSRFIKNAEIVLIPQFLPEGSGLRALYDTMVELGIDQVNTGETSKAANKNFATFFDENGAENEDGTIKFYPEQFKAKAPALIEDYYYRNLFKQQDVVDHIDDTENKAGIQIMKKILDNAVSETDTDSKEVQDAKQAILDNFAINIKNDFNRLLDKCGWEVNNEGRVVNKNSNEKDRALNFNYFKKRFIREAERLGLDPDFLNYLETDDNGTLIIPTWLNSSSDKMESIAQAVFNNNITRQTLPGFHAVQASSVGTSSKLHYTQADGSVLVECKVPMWDNNIKKRYKELNKTYNNPKIAKQVLIDELSKNGLDKFIGYRIPTEGKQSVAIFKVVDFLEDVQGSTIIVPHEWVTQTGSDFDVDTIYTITYPTTYSKANGVGKYNFNETTEELYAKYFAKEFADYGRELEEDTTEKTTFDEINKEYKNKKKDKSLTDADYTRYISLLPIDAGIKTPKQFSKLSHEEQLTKNHRNTAIVDAFITVMSNPHSFEENVSRSNFDDVTAAKNDNESLLFGDDINSRSTYNPFDQVKFMQNAIDGRKLKAFSVTRDTFNSINNVVRTELSKDHQIKVRYNLSEYNLDTLRQAYDNVEISDNGDYAVVTHDRIGNSKNNRNVLGKLLTPYSSQTTAHILDAIKQGALYNETDYTFKVFKTLVDVGMDYDTAVAFLMQPAITRINEDYEKSNSIFVHSYAQPINHTILDLIKELGYTNNGTEITHSTNLNELLDNLKSTNLFARLNVKFNANILVTNPETQETYLNISSIALNKEECKKRLSTQKQINDKKRKLDNDNLLFDLGVALLYKKYAKSAQIIEDIAKCCKPDSFGAKQTVHSTKTVLANIEKFMSNSDEHGTALITKDGQSIIKAIYPNFSIPREGNITLDENDSKYKYLAYFLKYATIPSVQVNSTLFDTEGPAFSTYTTLFESMLGRPLTDEEYKEFKKYTVSKFYYDDANLTLPLTIDDKGMIVQDNLALFNEDGSVASSINEIRRKEIRRIFGYEEAPDSDNFKVKNKNKPTTKELATYKYLTPLQKVAFIKQNWPGEAGGIFKYATINKTYANEIASQGYSKNIIRINTYKKEMSVYYDDFIKALSNTNPLIKLAAVDLVKYAYLVEGGRYRNNSITKCMPSDILKADTNAYGLNLLYDFKRIFKEVLDTPETITERDEFLDSFMRSHPNIIKNVILPSPENNNIGAQFNTCEEQIKGQRIGLICIPNDDAHSELIHTISVGNDKVYRYIKISHRLTANSKPTVTLYRMQPHYISTDAVDSKENIDKFYLIPLPLLDVNEAYEVSQNEKYNNGFYSKQFYIDYINEKYNDTDINLNEYKIITEKQKFSNTSSENSLQNAFNGSGPMHELAKLFMDRAVTLVERNEQMQASDNAANAMNTNIYVYTKNANQFDIAKLFGLNHFVHNYQHIYINGREYTIHITGLNKNIVASISKASSSYKESIAAKGLVADVLNTIEHTTHEVDGKQLYNIHLELATDTASSINNQNDDGSEDDFSMFKGIYTEAAMSANSTNTLEDEGLANYLVHDIVRSANNPANILANDAKRQFYAKNIDVNSLQNIIDKQKDVYSIALDYYRGAAADLLSKINAFRITQHPDTENENETVFAIDNPVLYDKLETHPEDVKKLYTLVTQCRYFGQIIRPVLDSVSTDDETVKEIQSAIDSVVRNPKVNKAVEYIFNKYIAHEYSTNPFIKARVVDLLDQFGDLSWFETNIGDILHTNNKLIQVVVKLANETEYEAQFQAKDKLKDFDAFLKGLEDELGNETIQEALDKIITKDGKFISKFKDAWLADKQDVEYKEEKALADYGKYSKEYLIAKYNKDKWFAENVEQIGVDTYYLQKLGIEYKLITNYFDIYSRYLKLTDELNNQYGRIVDLSDDELEKRKSILDEISGLRSKNPEFNRQILALKDLNAKYTINRGTSLYEANKARMEQICEKIKNAHPDKEHSQLIEDYPEYKNAYEWLKYNAPFEYDNYTSTTIKKWRSILADAGEKTEEAKAYNAYLENLKTKYAPYVDRTGALDARKISSEELATLKELLYARDNITPDSKYIAKSLIKVGQPDYILTREYYDRRDNINHDDTVNLERRELFTQINDLIQHGIETTPDGKLHLNCVTLANNLTVDQLTALANLYYKLRESSHEAYKANNEESSNSKNKEFKPVIKYNKDEYNANNKQLDDIADTEKRNLIKQIISNTVGKKKKRIMPNYYIYGYIEVNKDFIDEEKTEARRNLNKNVEYVPTEYYEKAKAAAEELDKTQPGAYNKWYLENHYYEAREHTYVPLPIWTIEQIKPDSEVFGNVKRVAVPDYYNSTKEFKNTTTEHYLNDNYVPYSNNYKSTTTYDNPEFKSLNTAELKLYNKLTYISDYYAKNSRQHKFINEGYAPRDFKEIANKEWYVKQFLGFWGIADRNYTSPDDMKYLEYTDEMYGPYDMYTLLKTKDSIKEEILPRKEDFEDEITYQKRLEEVKAANKEIQDKNIAIDNSVLNRDWIQVYKLLIERGEIANAKYDMKDLLFLTLATLKNTFAERVNSKKDFNKELSIDRINSTIDKIVHNKDPKDRATELYTSWMHKYLYGRFKTYHPFKKIADDLQAFTSAKYMMMNLRGGIANVNTGLVNIMGEQLAGEYFGHKDFITASLQYATAIPGLIGDFFTDNGRASNEISAICKLFEIVDLDEMMGAPSSSKDLDVTKVSEKVNSILYSFMGSGEHYMQNSALIAILNSHKIYRDPESGKQVVGTLDDYTQGIEIAAFTNIISDEEFIAKHPELENIADDFNNFVNTVRSSDKAKNEKYKFETLHRNLITEFIRSHYVPRQYKVELSKLYKEQVATLKDKAKEDFTKEKSVRSQLEFDKTTGTEVIKEGSMLTNKHLAELKNKAIYINKKIHGVYDKMGAAQIEQKYWWGSLVMQYHKHIYPGYLKRWRTKGYYNETTHSFEKGSRISLFNLIFAPFRKNIDFKEDGTVTSKFDTETEGEAKTALRSILALKKVANDLLLEYAIYWNTMPEWERRNLMRNIGDLSGIAAGLLLGMLIHMLFDDDTKRNSKIINTGLYLADRLYTESRMYNVLGAYAEFSTQWSQPVAAIGLIKDSIKAIDLTYSAIVDPDDFDPIYNNTQYKGQNKFMVLLKRNIPILRVINRYQNVARNNTYYRINDNNSAQKVAKNIGIDLHDILLPGTSRQYGANKRGGAGAVGENVLY